jgi:hypothetical protein
MNNHSSVIGNQDVFGIFAYRTDTCKAGSESLHHYCDEYGQVEDYYELYSRKDEAEKMAERLNKQEKEYSNRRYRVVALKVR